MGKFLVKGTRLVNFDMVSEMRIEMPNPSHKGYDIVIDGIGIDKSWALASFDTRSQAESAFGHIVAALNTPNNQIVSLDEIVNLVMNPRTR